METPGRIVFDQVSKRFRLGSLGSLRGVVTDLLARPSRRAEDNGRLIWALDDVSFTVSPGECLGLIGPNGAGKTTTLKLVSRITTPTRGHVSVGGRMSSLIELGAGFHPELTGRENIYLNGAILGLRRHELAQRLDAIIDFSGLSRFIDTPVKRYSSGMYVRLGFSIAAHVDPQILLIDEVLAVGDTQFRQQCLDRIAEIKSAGTTIVFVSHNMYLVRRVCDRTMLLVAGRARYQGDTEGAIEAYEGYTTAERGGIAAAGDDGGLWQSELNSDVVSLSVFPAARSDGVPPMLRYDGALQMRVEYHNSGVLADPVVRARIIRRDGTVCAMFTSRYQAGFALTMNGHGFLDLTVDPLQLATGDYTVEVEVLDSGDTQVLGRGHSDWLHAIGPHLAHETDRGVYYPHVTWAEQASMGSALALQELRDASSRPGV